VVLRKIVLLCINTCVFVAGRPEEQDDSENSTIYITGLTEKATLEEMAEFFKHVGPIRVRIALHLKDSRKHNSGLN